jgi:hypothetical protein
MRERGSAGSRPGRANCLELPAEFLGRLDEGIRRADLIGQATVRCDDIDLVRDSVLLQRAHDLLVRGPPAAS